MTIWEKLARCNSPGEIQRMVRGTNWELVKSTEIERLRVEADANICCPECGFVGPAKDWEISDIGHSAHRDKS